MRQLALVASIAILLAHGAAIAADTSPLLGPDSTTDAEEGRLQVIQRRRYPLANELSISGGVLPMDPYYKGWTGTVGYTFHFNDDYAWEVVQVTWAYNTQTALLTKLINTAVASNDQPPELPAIQWVVATHLVLKPLYGKEALFNTRVFHLEAFVQGGPALLNVAKPPTNSVSQPLAGGQLDLGIDLGAGLRFWLTDAMSARFDLGELVYLHPVNGSTRVKQSMSLRLGLAFTFGGDE